MCDTQPAFCFMSTQQHFVMMRLIEIEGEYESKWKKI